LDDKKIKEFLEGKLSDHEIGQFINDLAESGDYDTLDKLFDGKWKDSKDYASKEVFSDVLFSENESRIKKHRTSGSWGISGIKLFKYAAVIAILLSAFFFLQKRSNPSEKEIVEVEFVTKITTAGQKSTIMLSDGSKVTLNSESMLRYPKKFSDTGKIIHMEGEAFFQVAKDQARPFIVIANGISTTALGTSFNINSREQWLKVSLATGKVVVRKESPESYEKYYLNPGEALSFNNLDSGAVHSRFDSKKDLLWKDGVLYFENDEFDEMIERIESWYGVSFEIRDHPSAIKTYTGQFQNESLDNVLKSMGFALNFDYFLNDKKITLIFNEKI
jgi:transmembrane sensor